VKPVLNLLGAYWPVKVDFALTHTRVALLLLLLALSCCAATKAFGKEFVQRKAPMWHCMKGAWKIPPGAAIPST
jgi:hypothetical protein